MLSTKLESFVNTSEQEVLLDVAEQSIQFGLETSQPREPRIESYPDSLRRLQASFVKLRVGEGLHGCAGSVEAKTPLAIDIARNAFAAAFCNTHRSNLHDEDLALLTIEISVLSPLAPLTIPSVEQAVALVRPQVDGVLLTADGHAAAFLPEMWAKYAEPHEFFRQLQRKAGLSGNDWSSQTQLATFTTQCFSRAAPIHPKPRRAK